MRRMWNRIVPLSLPSLCGWLIILAASVWAQPQGYRLVGQSVVISDRAHWSTWEVFNDYTRSTTEVEKADVVDLTSDGRIGPRFFRKSTEALVGGVPTRIPGINACLDAPRFAYEDLLRKKDARGGVRDVGSNRASVFDPLGTSGGDTTWTVMDGDRNTFWEPDIEDPLRKWSIEIDLGRLVHATEIVIKFVEQELGDPFKQFAVLVSNGKRAFPELRNSIVMDYRLVWSTKKPSEEQRVFEIPLKPLDRALDFEGAAIQYVQIYATDSDFGRGKRVDRAQYEALEPDLRGTIEYFRKTAGGGERPVAQEVYEALPPERQGRKVYYRRERPRLAEVEVWAVGENIGLGLLKRGGSAEDNGGTSGDPSFDGVFGTSYNQVVWWPFREKGILTVDLGALFWVDMVNIFCRADPSGASVTVDGYELYGSDGARGADGQIVWDLLSPESRRVNPGGPCKGAKRFTDTLDPPRKLRLLQLKNIDVTGRRAGAYLADANIAELQIYGEGYVPELRLISPWITMGEARNLSTIGWKASVPHGTEIELRTRTAEESHEVHHYYDRLGKEISKEKWEKKKPSLRGKHTVERVIIGSSGWSPPYKLSGATSPSPVLSPSPRALLQIEALFRSQDPYIRPLLEEITVDFLPAVASALQGEIGVLEEDGLYRAPRDLDPAESHTFSYFIRSHFTAARQQGFDDILLTGPSFSGLHCVRIGLSRVDTIAVFEKGEWDSTMAPPDRGAFLEALSPVSHRPGWFLSASRDSIAVIDTTLSVDVSGDSTKVVALERVRFTQRFSDEREEGVFANETGEPLVLMPSGSDSLWIHLPYRITRPSDVGWHVLVEVQFASRAVLNPSPFAAAVANADIPNSWQEVDRKEASKLVEGHTSDVSPSLRGGLIGPVRIQPQVITPNGDGINDEATIRFSLFKLRGERMLEVHLYALSGEIVRVLHAAPGTSGDYEIVWRGEDQAGDRVPPGVYLSRVKVRADAEEASVFHPVYIVY